jgi:Putative peptidase family
MVGGIIVGALLVMWVSSVSELSAQPLANVSTSPITVLVCDRAGVSGTDRIEAREVADRILKRAQIQMTWLDNRDCVGPKVESYLTIVILPQRPKDMPSSTLAMGRATLIESPYPRAYIFLDRVRRFDSLNRAMSARSNQGVILGHAITHELGHLLGLSHAPAGIMRAEWGREEWKAAVSGTLLFSLTEPKSVGLMH